MQCQGTNDEILMYYAKELINGDILQSICICMRFNASLYACVFACMSASYKFNVCMHNKMFSI